MGRSIVPLNRTGRVIDEAALPVEGDGPVVVGAHPQVEAPAARPVDGEPLQHAKEGDGEALARRTRVLRPLERPVDPRDVDRQVLRPVGGAVIRMTAAPERDRGVADDLSALTGSELVGRRRRLALAGGPPAARPEVPVDLLDPAVEDIEVRIVREGEVREERVGQRAVSVGDDNS